jgi:hypothetical protein
MNGTGQGAFLSKNKAQGKARIVPACGTTCCALAFPTDSGPHALGSSGAPVHFKPTQIRCAAHYPTRDQATPLLSSASGFTPRPPSPSPSPRSRRPSGPPRFPRRLGRDGFQCRQGYSERAESAPVPPVCDLKSAPESIPVS